jgi:hypothetical protein
MSSRAPDIPVVIHGFVTDPKLVGYQILTNYESIYWRALVGNDAWSLYETLRSFCHEGNNTCFPSIRLLMDILGIKQRRVLTGWSTTVKSKSYQYPGLIELLQEAKLIIAELHEEATGVRYIFHVNLTPGLLTDEQLERIPTALQAMHASLLKRLAENQEALESRRRPSKLQRPQLIAPNIVAIEGGDNLSGGGDNLSPKQQPINNTHTTVAATRMDSNNNGGNSDHDDVVVALTGLGIAGTTVQRLVHRYNRTRIDEKIAFLKFLQEEQPEKVKNPRGWLRRAIEDDYGPPDGYVSAAERERRRREAERQDAQETALVEARQLALAAATSEQAARLQRRRDEYGATEEDVAFWAEAREAIRDTTTPHVYELVADTELLQLSEDTLRIGVRSEAEQRQLTHPGSVKAIERTLSRLAGQQLALQVEVLT